MNKILIVEDDKNIAFSLEIRLRDAGYQVMTSADAVNAVKAIVEFCPDLVLVDIAIPAGGGFSVVEQMQNMSNREKVPFIFITASQAPGIKEKGEGLGAYAFVNKPYDFGELRSAITGALRERDKSLSPGE